jgi:hypothetical protein
MIAFVAVRGFSVSRLTWTSRRPRTSAYHRGQPDLQPRLQPQLLTLSQADQLRFAAARIGHPPVRIAPCEGVGLRGHPVADLKSAGVGGAGTHGVAGIAAEPDRAAKFGGDGARDAEAARGTICDCSTVADDSGVSSRHPWVTTASRTTASSSVPRGRLGDGKPELSQPCDHVVGPAGPVVGRWDSVAKFYASARQQFHVVVAAVAHVDEVVASFA